MRAGSALLPLVSAHRQVIVTVPLASVHAPRTKAAHARARGRVVAQNANPASENRQIKGGILRCST